MEKILYRTFRTGKLIAQRRIGMIIYSVTQLRNINRVEEAETIVSFKEKDNATDYVSSLKYLHGKIGKLYGDEENKIEAKMEAKKLILILCQLGSKFEGVGNSSYSISENIVKDLM